MTYDDFLAIDLDLNPESASELSPALAALALDRAGNWKAAHAEAARSDTPATNRIHAYLHRKEGDLGNARYWYERVGEPMPDTPLDAEWTMLVDRFLTDQSV